MDRFVAFLAGVVLGAVTTLILSPLSFPEPEPETTPTPARITPTPARELPLQSITYVHVCDEDATETPTPTPNTYGYDDTPIPLEDEIGDADCEFGNGCMKWACCYGSDPTEGGAHVALAPRGLAAHLRRHPFDYEDPAYAVGDDPCRAINP